LAGGIWDKLLIISGSRLLIKILITTWHINHPFSHGFEVFPGIGIMSPGYPRTYQSWAENHFITLMNTIRWYMHPTNIPIDDETVAPLNFWWSPDSDCSKWGLDIRPITGRGRSNPKIWPWKIQDDPYVSFRGCSIHPLASQFPVEVFWIRECLFDIFSITVNACLEPLHSLVKCDHYGLEWNVSQNSNHPIEKLFCSLEFCPLEQPGE
jgi:hypothetical protein